MRHRLTAFLFLLLLTMVRADDAHRITVDFSAAEGELRALHGINKGPLSANGLVDLTDAHRRLRVPPTRLHDCHHPNPDVVDVHAIFPIW